MLAIVALATVFFAWGRWPADLVAVVALVAAVLLGVVPMNQALRGFGDPALVTLAAVAVMSAAVRGSGLFDFPVRVIDLLPKRAGLRVGLASALVAAASAFLNNADAAASFMPAAQSTARQTGRPLNLLALILTLASLVGGTATLIGTAPNILVSTVRRNAIGADFGIFAFAPVGVVLAVAAVLLLLVFWRVLLPATERATEQEAILRDATFTGELLVPPDSPLIGQTIAAVQSRGESRVRVAAVIREDFRRLTPRPDWVIEPNDVLVLACMPETLQHLMETTGLRIAGGAGTSATDPEQTAVVEAVVTPASTLVGASGGSSRLDDRHRLGLLAIGRHGSRPPVRLRRARFRAGDVLVLQGELGTMAETLANLGCLPVAERRLRLSRRRFFLVPALILAGALALSVAAMVPVAVALLCGLAVLVLLRLITLPELYATVPWPTLVLVGALLPFGAALRSTGIADALVGGLPAGFMTAPPLVLVGSVVALSLLATLLVRSIPAALLLAPVVLSLAAQRGVAADPLLMAVAVGASCDFGTAGGRPRLRQVGRFWLPLLVAVALIAPPTILLFWPLHP